MNHLFGQNCGTTQLLLALYILYAPLKNTLSEIHYLIFKMDYQTKSSLFWVFFFLISGKGGIIIMQENTKRQNCISRVQK